MPPQQLVGNSQYSNRGGAETQGENRVSATLRLFFYNLGILEINRNSHELL